MENDSRNTPQAPDFHQQLSDPIIRETSNEDVLDAAYQEPVVAQICRRKWVWTGHTFRKPASNATRQAVTWNPQGKGKREDPGTHSAETLLGEMQRSGHSWKKQEKTVQSRVRWRSAVGGQCCS